MTDSNPSSAASPASGTDLRELTADVVAAYVAKNAVPMAELPGLIGSVHGALAGLRGGADGGASGPGEIEPAEPAVPVRRSVKEDAISCLVCGRAFKSIKRHLGTAHDLTPDAYRTMFSLKPDYPMVAPAYAAARSEMARSIGLGRKKGDAAPEATKADKVGQDEDEAAAGAKNRAGDATDQKAGTASSGEPDDGSTSNGTGTKGGSKPAGKRRTRRKAPVEE